MRIEIPIFASEREFGIAHLVRQYASVSYLSPVSILSDEGVKRSLTAASAGVAGGRALDFDDLAFITDILATTGWNLNDDVFGREEVWAARKSSEDKPFNFEHNQSDIIGHIVACRPVTASLEDIPDDTAVEDLPDKFHIHNSTAIYKEIGDEERKRLIAATLEEIARGEWCVSMEAFFSGFDYAVIAPNGDHSVVNRTSSTAWLTKYLRAYAPRDSDQSPEAEALRAAMLRDPSLFSGSYADPQTGESYRLGRHMRNIAFCGKGLVRKPANPESTILSVASAFGGKFSHQPILLISGYEPENRVNASKTEEFQEMPENGDEKLTAANERIAELERRLTEANAARHQEQLAEKDEVIASLEEKLAAAIKKADEAASRADSAESALTTATEALTKANADLDEARTTLARIEAEKTEAARLSKVTEAGLDKGAATAFVRNTAGLPAEQFEATVAALAPTWKRKPVSGIEAIENATPEPEPAMASAKDEASDRESLQAAMNDWYMSGRKAK